MGKGETKDPRIIILGSLEKPSIKYSTYFL